jgi:hypothetical protein
MVFAHLPSASNAQSIDTSACTSTKGSCSLTGSIALSKVFRAIWRFRSDLYSSSVEEEGNGHEQERQHRKQEQGPLVS